MATIALKNNDIYVEDGGLAYVSGKDQIITELRQNLLSLGISAYLNAGVSPERLAIAVRSKIAETNGILSISSFSAKLVDSGCGASRKFDIKFSVNTSFGEISFG